MKVLLASLVAALGAAGCGWIHGREVRPLGLTSVEIEGRSPTLSARVRGRTGGCWRISGERQSREGSTLTLSILESQPGGGADCPTDVRPYERTFVLLGGFEPGSTYTLHANALTKTFTAP
jgi:hypothetical protein